MKKKRIPLFSGYRKRREEAKRREIQENLVKDLNKTMAQQRARVLKVRPKAKTEESGKHTAETKEKPAE